MFDFLFVSVAILLAYFSSLLLNIDIIPSSPSEYELKKRARDGNAAAKQQAWVKKHASEVSLTFKLVFLILQGLFILMLSLRMKAAWPALLVYLVTFVAVRVAMVKDIALKSFTFWHKLLTRKAQDIVRIFKLILDPIYSSSSKDTESAKAYYSEEEFAYRFGIDSDVLSEGTRNKIERMLKGSKTRAKDIMLEIKAVPGVDVNLSLTPIIYDELHKKGYDMAIVFQGPSDNYVGLLHLSGPEAVGQLSTPTSTRVGDKMEQGLQYVTEDVKLDDLVAGFLQGGQNAVLVTGAGGRVSGVITARKLLAWITGA